MAQFIAAVAMVMFLGIVAITMETAKEMQKRQLAHKERMKELEIEQLRLGQTALGPDQAARYLPDPSDTLVRRGRTAS